jgi:hypothetical protein
MSRGFSTLNVSRIISSLLLIIVTSILTFYILYNASFLFGDDVQFLQKTAIGKYLPVSDYIYPGIGRFLPLTLWDFNLLTIIHGGESAVAHFTLVASSFILLAILTYFFYTNLIGNLSKYGVYIPLLSVLCVIFILARFYSVFLELHFSERMVIILLTGFLLFSHKFFETEKWQYGVTALVIACYVVYCKEPVFAAFLAIASTPLIFDFGGLKKNHKIFLFVLALNSLVFLGLYYMLVYRSNTIYYTGGNVLMAKLDLALKVFRSHKLLLTAFILAAIRLFYILFKHDRKNLYYDSLLFGGISYTIVVLSLGLNFSYYYFPAVVLSLPALLFWALKLVHIRWITLAILAGSAYSLAITISDIKENQERRLNTTIQINELAKSVKDGYSLVWYQSALDGSYKHYQTVRDWKKNTLESYLQYAFKSPEHVELPAILSTDDLGKRHKTIVLYSSENEFNKGETDAFLNMLSQKGISLIFNSNGIKSYLIK